MKESKKEYGKYLEIILIILTFISLIISSLEYTNMIYNWSYDTMKLNDLLISTPFNVALWIDNILLILFSIFYAVDTIRKRKNILLSLSFCIVSLCTTMIVSISIINLIAKIFNIF